MLNDCTFVIAHAGVGTIVEALKRSKKVIVVPRLKKYKEHVDDHQIEMISLFSEKNYVCGVFEICALKPIIEKIPYFLPDKFASESSAIIEILQNYISVNFTHK